MSLFQRRHYAALAKIIAAIPDNDATIEVFIEHLKKDSPSFKADVFRKEVVSHE